MEHEIAIVECELCGGSGEIVERFYSPGSKMPDPQTDQPHECPRCLGYGGHTVLRQIEVQL